MPSVFVPGPGCLCFNHPAAHPREVLVGSVYPVSLREIKGLDLEIPDPPFFYSSVKQVLH